MLCHCHYRNVVLSVDSFPPLLSARDTIPLIVKLRNSGKECVMYFTKNVALLHDGHGFQLWNVCVLAQDSSLKSMDRSHRIVCQTWYSVDSCIQYCCNSWKGRSESVIVRPL